MDTMTISTYVATYTGRFIHNNPCCQVCYKILISKLYHTIYMYYIHYIFLLQYTHTYIIMHIVLLTHIYMSHPCSPHAILCVCIYITYLLYIHPLFSLSHFPELLSQINLGISWRLRKLTSIALQRDCYQAHLKPHIRWV